jgi:ankyrin repeat protein
MRLRELAVENNRALHENDRNGWQPIHEAARGGHTEAIKTLVEFGADINARTNHGKGGTPLHVAITSLSEKHPVAQYLVSLGALNIGPDEL